MSLGWLIEIGQIQQTVTCVADTTVTVICHSVTVLWCDSLTDNCHSRVCRIYARQSIPSNVSVTWHNFDQPTAHVMRQIKTDFMLYFSRTFNRLKRHLSLHAWMRRGGLATRVPMFISHLAVLPSTAMSSDDRLIFLRSWRNHRMKYQFFIAGFALCTIAPSSSKQAVS